MMAILLSSQCCPTMETWSVVCHKHLPQQTEGTTQNTNANKTRTNVELQKQIQTNEEKYKHCHKTYHLQIKLYEIKGVQKKPCLNPK